MPRTIRNFALPIAKNVIQRGLLGFVLKGDKQDEIIGRSLLGTPIYSNLIFNASEDTPENKDLRIDTVLMTVNMVKNIVRTSINNRPGTVKEYISDGDFMIDFRGVIVGKENRVLPKDDILAFISLMQVPKQLDIASNFLQLFSINSIVVTDFRLAEEFATRNEMPFKFSALSDEPIELQLDPVVSNVDP